MRSLARARHAYEHRDVLMRGHREDALEQRAERQRPSALLLWRAAGRTLGVSEGREQRPASDGSYLVHGVKDARRHVLDVRLPALQIPGGAAVTLIMSSFRLVKQQ